MPFREPTFTKQPPLNVFPEPPNFGYRVEPVIIGRKNYFDPHRYLAAKAARKEMLNRVATYMFLVGVALVFVAWCVWLATDAGQGFGECHGQRVTGYSNGHYTSLCIENNP